MTIVTKSLSLLLQTYPSDCLMTSTLSCMTTYIDFMILVSLCPLLFPSLFVSCQPMHQSMHHPYEDYASPANQPHVLHDHPQPVAHHPPQTYPPGLSNLWPEVRLPHGIVKGRTFRTNNGRDFFAFLGIPYATPPLGPLRFKPPVPTSGWNHVLSASSYKDPCPQFDSRATELGNEDCLYLNVYTPEIQTNVYNAKYPVMVYIQAESFENGDSSLYGPEKLLDKGVVVVTFNYRLGLLGFLSTEDDSASGNWGLHDQRLVLEWIKQNIDHFSGDPHKVTIFGQGAGGASVIFHLISPSSRGLFSAVIAQSGSALCDWAVERNPRQYAISVAESLGCPSHDTSVLVECLRSLSPSSLLRAQAKHKSFGEFPTRASPVIETPGRERFMTEEPRSGLKNLKNRHPKVPLMIGVNRDEASFFYPMITDAYFKYGRNSLYHERELIPRFLEAATDFKGPDVQKRILPSILFHYFNGVDTNNVSSVANRFINMSSDVLYNSCVDETVKVYWSTQAPVYQYLFHYKGSNSMVSLLMNSPSHSRLWDTGVCHGDDLFLLFNMRILGLREENNRDRRISERMTTLWTDFAKTGSSPRIESFEFPRWPKWDPDSMVFYRIGEEISVGSNYKQFESFLWSHRLRNISGLGANGSHTVGFPWLTESSAGNVGIGMYSGSLISESNINKTGYQTLAWSMIVVSVSLFVLIVILVSVLYLQRRRQTFRAETPASTSHLSGSAMLY